MPLHNGGRIVLVIMSAIVFGASAVFTFLKGAGNEVLFPNSTSAMADNYSTVVTPAEFTHTYIWIITYAYQGLFVLYAFCSLFRSSGPGYLYTHPDFLPPSLYVTFMLSHACTLVWLFTWSRDYLIVALVFVLLSAIMAIIAVCIASYRIFADQGALVAFGHPTEYRLVYLLVINPLGLHAMWLTITSLLHLSMNLVFNFHVSMAAAGAISLTILTAYVIFYSLLDLAFFESYVRYLYTPFMTLIWVTVGIFMGNLDWDSSNTIFVLGLTMVTCIVFLIKVVLSLARCVSNPLFRDGNGMPLLTEKPSVFWTGAPNYATPPEGMPGQQGGSIWPSLGQ